MYEHEIALQELNLNVSNLPLNLKGKISAFKKQQNIAMADPNNAAEQTRLKIQSIAIADALQDYVEKDLPDEETQNPNNMLKDKDLERAIAVGLTETATMEQVESAEKVAQEMNAAKAAKDAEDAAAAEKAAKESAEAAEKSAKEAQENGDAQKAADEKAAAEKAAAEEAAKQDWKKTALGAIGL